MGYINITYFITSSESLLTNREKLDRRRAEAAYFQFALLRVAAWYPHLFTLSDLSLHKNLENTLSKVTEIYHGAFMDTYASKHE